MIWIQSRIAQEPAAGRDDLAHVGQKVGDGREAERDAFVGGLPQVERRRLEREPVDGAARVRVPAGRALAAEEGQEDEPVVARVALGERSRGVGEGVLEPLVEVAAVGERAALDDVALVGEVEEEPRLRLRPLALVEDAECARGADHERGALAPRAARARVRAGGVAPEREVGEPRQSLGVEPERGEQLFVPVARREVEQAARRGNREGRLGAAAEIVGEGDEPGRAAEGLGLRLGEPGELGGPERGVEERARACVNRLGVESPREPLGRAGAAGVAPAEDRRERVPVARRPRRGCARSTRSRPVRSSPSTVRTAAATSTGSSVSYFSCRSSPAASARSSKRWARTDEEPTSRASTLIRRGRPALRQATLRARSTFGPLGASRTVSS